MKLGLGVKFLGATITLEFGRSVDRYQPEECEEAQREQDVEREDACLHVAHPARRLMAATLRSS